jgi:bacteriorhodopsin
LLLFRSSRVFFWLIFFALLATARGGAGVLGQCRVAAFQVFAHSILAVFFITFSHCAWRRVISLSKATKKRSKENAFRTKAHKGPQRAAFIHGYPKSTLLARTIDV